MQDSKPEGAAELWSGVASEMSDRRSAGSPLAPSTEAANHRFGQSRGSPLDTKTQIFNTALRLFATSGVENVSMRDIATAIGIKAASIYNHYISKEQIVEACYDFFLDNYDINRLNKEQYIPVLRNGTKEEVVRVTNNQFPKEIEENMIFAMIVLFSRIYTDAKAIDRYTRQIDDSMRFLKGLFETGIELGRFEEFNVRGVSMLFLSARLFVAQSVTIHPESLPDLRIAQQELISELTNIIPFKY